MSSDSVTMPGTGTDQDQEEDGKLESNLTRTFLNLEEIDPLLFRSTHLFQPVFGRAVFGGQVVGQALVAASKTVSEERPAHSLHCYFLRPGNVEKPILYHVQESRDGQTYSNRFVNATQDGKPIFTMMVSFKKAETDPFSHQFVMPEVLPPEECTEITDLLKRRLGGFDIGEKEREYIEHRLTEEMTIERRPVDPKAYFNEAPVEAKQYIWVKSSGHIGENQQMQKCAAAYMSDSTLIGTALLPSGLKMGLGRFFVTSVDHAIWFHHPVKADEWLLYEMESPQCGNGRALAQGKLWDRQGSLIMSVAQEGVVRTLAKPTEMPSEPSASHAGDSAVLLLGQGKAIALGRMWNRQGDLVLSVAQEGAVRTHQKKSKL